MRFLRAVAVKNPSICDKLWTYVAFAARTGRAMRLRLKGPKPPAPQRTTTLTTRNRAIDFSLFSLLISEQPVPDLLAAGLVDLIEHSTIGEMHFLRFLPPPKNFIYGKQFDFGKLRAVLCRD
jgi:hypothetical protein